MIVRENERQMDFSDQFFHPQDDPVPNDHKYLRLRDAIDWEKVLGELSSAYSENEGRPSIPLKNMVMILMIKHMEGLSDRDLTEKLSGSLPMQKALNITFRDAQNYFHPSLLSHFRARIGEAGAIVISDAVNNFVKKKGLAHGKTRAVDTTVAPSNILFPTDIRLLESARNFLLRVIRRNSRQPGKVRTYCRKARRTFLNYIKLRNAKRTKTRKVHGQMIRFVKRNLKQAREAYKETIQKSPKITGDLQKTARIMDTIEKMLRQQEELYRKTPRNGKKQGLRISNRIVSIYREYIRPIPRGKIPVSTEFGPKILFEMRSGFMETLKISFNNDADSEMLAEFFPRWENAILTGDRGFHSPANTKLGKKHGVKGYYIERKGKKPLPKTKAAKRARSYRAGIEAKISLAKRKFGLGRVLYGRGEEGEKQWIHLGIAAMNMDRALKLTGS